MEIRKVEDYIDKVAEKYDKIPKDVIKKVIDFGLRAYYRINSIPTESEKENMDFDNSACIPTAADEDLLFKRVSWRLIGSLL